MKYFKRAGIYKASNLDFNPETGLGHSYAWYEISKVIKGRQVLNTFNYSATTIKHHNKLWRLLKELGIEFITIEAPGGLQSLDSAQKHAAYLMAKALVRNKYARTQSTWDIGHAQNNIDNLAKIGIKVSKKLINEQLVVCESERASKLKRLRERRARYAAPALTVVQDASESL